MNEEHERAERGRNETEPEQLDRNTIELLNELRIASTGIQVLFAFLLVVPFQTGWKGVDPFERTIYFVTLLIVVLAAFMLMAPAVHHRVLFRHGEKAFLLRFGNRLAVLGLGCLAIGFTGILVLEADVVVGGAAPAIVGVLVAAVVTGLWFGVAFLREAQE